MGTMEKKLSWQPLDHSVTFISHWNVRVMPSEGALAWAEQVRVYCSFMFSSLGLPFLLQC